MTELFVEIDQEIRNLLLECGVTPNSEADTTELDAQLERATEVGSTHRPGVVYTGKREASLMCRLALADWLSRKLGSEPDELERILENSPLNEANLKHLEQIRILDPACGAGVFLIEMFDLLSRMTPWPPLEIAKHIFGADSDPLALRAAKLRLAFRVGKEVGEQFSLRDSLNPTAYNRDFDIVIGNPPYVRQEQIADPMKVLNPSAYKKQLRCWMSVHFNDISIDGRSDLYLYFFLRALSLLRYGGTCCLITTGSWLDTGFGASLRRLVTSEYVLRLVRDDESCRSFQQADVNPVIAVVAARPCDKDDQVRFISITHKEKVVKNRIPIDYLARRPQKWGVMYLLAKPIYYKMIEDGLLAPLETHPLVKKICRGIRTGWDSFFCLSAPKAAKYKIEPEYLKPLVKSPSEFVSVPPVIQSETNWFLFSCLREREELPVDSGALRYIKEVEREHGLNKKNWWWLEPGVPAEILLPVGFSERLFAVSNPSLAAAHQRFATLYPKNGAGPLLLALMRCSITLYFIELLGRRTLGQGALDIPPSDWKLIYVPNILLEKGNDIIKAAELLYKRPCLSVSEEMSNPDQVQLDTLVAIALGLDEPTMQQVRSELVNLVERRILRSRLGT